MLAAVLAAITLSLAFSLIASRSTVTDLRRETARLHAALGTSRAVDSTLKLQILAADGVSIGPFERVRDHVVAETAEFAGHRSAPETSRLPSPARFQTTP